jgi:nicotinate (nicotinamide) nucleotide adenylyltransferase
VRPAFPDEKFGKSCTWKNKLEFTVSDNGDFTMIWTSLLPDLDPEYAEALVDLVGARYPVSKQFEKLRSHCPELAFTNMSDEWVFFGGSFNPWHHGHQSCLDLLPDDKVCLIMPDRNPQKDDRHTTPVADILQVSTHAKFKKCQFLVPTFLMDSKKNPTVEWIEKLKDDFPTHKLSFLMGFDSFANLKTWVRPDDLLSKLDTIYVVSRLEDDVDRALALDESKVRGLKNVVFLGKHPYEHLSSTEIRDLY